MSRSMQMAKKLGASPRERHQISLVFCSDGNTAHNSAKIALRLNMTAVQFITMCRWMSVKEPLKSWGKLSESRKETCFEVWTMLVSWLGEGSEEDRDVHDICMLASVGAVAQCIVICDRNGAKSARYLKKVLLNRMNAFKVPAMRKSTPLENEICNPSILMEF